MPHAKSSRRWSLLVVLALLAVLGAGGWGGGTALAAKSVSRIRLGSPADVSPALAGPAYFLQGNGAPLASAFQVHINQVASAPLDVVVLAASFGSAPTPECDRLILLVNVNSCETITITQAAGANDSGATASVNKAEIVYFAGGDQCNYIGWSGSSVHTAVKGVVARGGGVGGGSAGLAIQGQFAYDACNGSVTSAEALANPYRRTITFTSGYFAWAPLGGVITDSHFSQRDRMGRLMVFVARQLQDGRASAAYGLGIDEDTAMLIDKNGLGTLYGGTAYVVLGDHRPELCASRQALTYSNFKLWKLTAGSTYNFSSRPATGYYLRSVTGGVISADPYAP
jgi:cyanophycinase